VTEASGEYGVSRPTYYQAQADFEEAGIAGLVPKKRGPRGPHKIQAEVLAFSQDAARSGRIDPGTRAGEIDPGRARPRGASKDDRACRQWKNFAMAPFAVEKPSTAASTAVAQYETLRRAMLGEALPQGRSQRTDALSASRHVERRAL
jgi:hypothetical protein